MTRTLESPGTPGYAAPERGQPGGSSDERGDQYSLAFTVWEMLAGSRPVGAFSKLHTLCRCPVGVDHVLRKALSTDPDDRYRDLRGFERAFLRAVRRPPWIRPFFISLSVGLLLLILYLGFRPEPFPREFQSGPLRVTEGRQQFVTVDLTLEQDGAFLAVVTSSNREPFFGFTGTVRLIWRDRDGNVLETLNSNPHGVNGRLVPGAPHERVDYWRDRLTPEMAAKVERVDFRATPGGISKEQRDGANRARVEKDMRKVKAGLRQLWDRLMPE